MWNTTRWFDIYLRVSYVNKSKQRSNIFQQSLLTLTDYDKDPLGITADEVSFYNLGHYHMES